MIAAAFDCRSDHAVPGAVEPLVAFAACSGTGRSVVCAAGMTRSPDGLIRWHGLMRIPLLSALHHKTGGDGAFDEPFVIPLP
jgi:hypothetical protein